MLSVLGGGGRRDGWEVGGWGGGGGGWGGGGGGGGAPPVVLADGHPSGARGPAARPRDAPRRYGANLGRRRHVQRVPRRQALRVRGEARFVGADPARVAAPDDSALRAG